MTGTGHRQVKAHCTGRQCRLTSEWLQVLEVPCRTLSGSGRVLTALHWSWKATQQLPCAAVLCALGQL
jgi:hypothetical protein